MKKYQSLLNETFDQPYKYKWESPDRAEFNSVNDTIRVDFITMGGFYRNDMKKTDKQLYNLSFYSTSASTNSVDNKTSKGDAFKVFATVIKIAKEFYQKSHVGGLILDVKDTKDAMYNAKARKVIYAKMIKSVGKGQIIVPATKHKMLVTLYQSMKSGTIVHKKGLNFENPMDKIMRGF